LIRDGGFVEVLVVCFEEVDEIAAGFFEDLQMGRDEVSEISV